MIIIGEKINGAIPSIKQAIADRNEELIISRVKAQANAGANYIDCAPSTATEIEYETMLWLPGLQDLCLSGALPIPGEIHVQHGGLRSFCYAGLPGQRHGLLLRPQNPGLYCLHSLLTKKRH